MSDDTQPIVPDRRVTDKGLGGKVSGMEERLAVGDARMSRIESDVREVLEIIRMGKSFFKVLGYIGQVVKWIGTIAIGIGSIWALITHGPTK